VSAPAVSGRARGITLIELLVALAVFSFVSVMAYAGLNVVLKSRAHTDAAASRLAALQMTMTMLGRDLYQAVPRPIRDEFGDSRPAMQVHDDDPAGFLEFTRAGWRNPANMPRSHLQRVAWGLREGSLERWYWSVLDRAQDSEPYPLAMLEGVEQFEARFMDADRRWHGDWPPSSGGIAGLPGAVEISVRLEDWGTVTRLFVLPGGAAAEVSRLVPEAAEQDGGATAEEGGQGARADDGT